MYLAVRASRKLSSVSDDDSKGQHWLLRCSDAQTPSFYIFLARMRTLNLDLDGSVSFDDLLRILVFARSVKLGTVHPEGLPGDQGCGGSWSLQ